MKEERVLQEKFPYLFFAKKIRIVCNQTAIYAFNFLYFVTEISYFLKAAKFLILIIFFTKYN
jgi:hypothetical protein